MTTDSCPNSFEQTSATEKGQSTTEPLERPARDNQRRWRRDPEIEAVEAVHQLSENVLAQQGTKSDNYVCRAVLACQQVNDPPSCRAASKPYPETCFAYRVIN